MAGGKINSVEMYGIVRSKMHGKYLFWQVSMRRRGMRFCKAFYDLKWEGSENALAAAKCYRDALIRRIPPMTMLEHLQTATKNNTSGFAGVYFKQGPSGAVSWSTQVRLPGGKTISKTFAESRHGSQARELAIQARHELLKLVDETRTLTFSPGAIAEANSAEFPAALMLPPRALTVRVSRPGINGGVANKYISVTVSGATSPSVRKIFSTNLYGQAGAFRLAMQAALKLAAQFGGEEAAQIFMRDYVEKYKRLPKKGVSARIRFIPVEDSTNHDRAKA